MKVALPESCKRHRCAQGEVCLIWAACLFVFDASICLYLQS